MKTLKHIILGLVLLLSYTATAQQGINYKALLKDDIGNVLVNQNVDIQFIIYEGATLTNNIYQENHTINTDANGFVILNIGEGTTSNIFTDINWNDDQHFLNVQINIGSGLIDMGTTQFMAVPYAKVAENVTGLEAIDEGNGIAWRLKAKHPDNYGDLGDNAIDLSESQVDSSTHGATGDFSIAMGVNTTAFGLSSFAGGIATDATGNVSFAMGSGTTASGDFSTSFGSSSTANGNYSTTFGLSNLADGNFSFTSGRGLNADAFYSSVFGRYNNGGGDPSEWLDQEPLFEIGNGTSDTNRSNALTVYKNGEHYINSDFVGLTINSLNTGLFINNPLTGIFINNPEQNGISVSSAGTFGGSFTGQTAGVIAQSSISENSDLILGGGDGILSASSFSNSDLYLRSNNRVIVELDHNDDEGSFFTILNGDSNILLLLDEAGNMSITGRLLIGNEIIEDGGSDVLAFSSSLVPTVDDSDRLGGPNRRWQDIYAVNGVIQTSDRREKKNIKDLNYGLAEVLQMQPVSFNWKNKNNPDLKLGLIAQDMQELIPEVVISHTWEKDEATGTLTKKEVNRLGVYYSDLVPVLIKAIQELKQESEVLKSRIEALEKK